MTTVSELRAIARGIEAMESEWKQQRPNKSAISSVFGLWREGMERVQSLYEAVNVLASIRSIQTVTEVRIQAGDAVRSRWRLKLKQRCCQGRKPLPKI